MRLTKFDYNIDLLKGWSAIIISLDEDMLRTTPEFNNILALISKQLLEIAYNLKESHYKNDIEEYEEMDEIVIES